jgi:HAD superfamily hydrolase (TIGR01459 family)
VFDAPTNTHGAFERYEAVRARLPQAEFPATSQHLAHLGEVADDVDGFVLDAFGVLNVGKTAIPGAVDRLAGLRARGKKLCVLSNAASFTRTEALAKYQRLGFDFTADEVITSRDVAVARMNAVAPGAVWAALADITDDFHDLPATVLDAANDPDALDHADAIFFLASQRVTPKLYARLLDAMERNPRPMIVANPDLTAPFEDSLSREPGLFAHDLIDRLGSQLHWYGKPFADGYDDVLARMELPAERLAMVGDTLHTDVLGGRAAGMKTVLVSDHGLFRGHDVMPFITKSGIVPDYIVPTT